MSQFRDEKNMLRKVLLEDSWQSAAAVNSAEKAIRLASPLLALLPRHEYKYRAAWVLGKIIALLAEKDVEAARNFMRRLLWNLNEESGGVGWGLPEAMACIVAQSPQLAKEFGRIFLSYALDTCKDDNYIDHAPLRQGVFWGIGHVAAAWPQPWTQALPVLAAALQDPDIPCRTMAAWALGQLAENFIRTHTKPELAPIPVWRGAMATLEPLQHTEACVEIFEKERVFEVAAAEVYRTTHGAIARLLA